MSTASLTEAVEAFLRKGHLSGLAAATTVNYRRRAGLLIRFLHRRGCRRLPDVTADDLHAFLTELVADGRTKQGRMSIASLVKQFFSWCHEQGWTIRDPARSLPLPHEGEPDLPEPPLSVEEITALFGALPRRKATDLRNVCLLEILYGCGLRIAEALALAKSDIDFVRMTVQVRNGKGGKDRLLPLTQTVAAAARDWFVMRRTLLRGPDTGILFLTERGVPMGRPCVDDLFRVLRWRRGPEARRIHPHLFRHSIAVHLLRGGADVRYIQEFLGHASLDTTKIYLRLVPGHLREDYDAAMPDINVGLEPP